jgi:hypothetical protein
MQIQKHRNIHFLQTDEQPQARTLFPNDRRLPLLAAWARFALIANDRVQFELDWVLWRIPGEALAPVVAYGVGKDVAVPGEGGCSDAASNLGVALETVLGVFVPEVEGAVATSCAEGAVLRVEGDCVDRVNFGHVARIGVLLAVALEREVEAGKWS